MRTIITIKLLPLAMVSLVCAVASSTAIAETSSPPGSVPVETASPPSSAPLEKPISPAQGLIDNRFVVNAGAFIVGTDMTVSLNGNAANTSDIDLNSNLDKPTDAKRSRLDILWRINPKHHVRFLYFNNDVTRTKTLAQDISYGDYTFINGSYLESQAKLTVYELAYEYAFMHEPDYEISASAGVHYLEMSLQFSGTATYSDGINPPSSASFTSKSSNLPAPLPVIGVRGGWAVSPKWYLDAQAQFLQIGYEGYKGYWSDLRLGATWMFSKHFGVGMGYNAFAVHVDVNKPNFDGKLKMGYSGLQAFLTGTY
jgi:hypothetical protein